LHTLLFIVQGKINFLQVGFLSSDAVNPHTLLYQDIQEFGYRLMPGERNFQGAICPDRISDYQAWKAAQDLCGTFYLFFIDFDLDIQAANIPAGQLLRGP
jgi:hypothetical protein